MVHSFDQSLAKSHRQEDAPWWTEVYRRAFPDLRAMVNVRQDGWAQRGGIDRVLTLGSGKTLTVDEKVREKDYGDVLLEYWSDYERRDPGWVAKDLACDLIAYAVVPTEKCYLLPFQQLRCVWRTNGRDWVRRFKKIEALNAGRSGGTYTTVSVAVPTETLLDGMRDVLCVAWSQPS